MSHQDPSLPPVACLREDDVETTTTPPSASPMLHQSETFRDRLNSLGESEDDLFEDDVTDSDEEADSDLNEPEIPMDSDESAYVDYCNREDADYDPYHYEGSSSEESMTSISEEGESDDSDENVEDDDDDEEEEEPLVHERPKTKRVRFFIPSDDEYSEEELGKGDGEKEDCELEALSVEGTHDAS
ncbi:hypothetical protein RRG08_061484 [Elysia crispata]|uniref:Uncharacterized protein n=1 Tax=Elysia crispata TaxID=231223 RepID=A0AAE1CXX6_9GAST|nr:hypothetical protein RRG08_061484 [Elysia crispata]